MVALGSFLRLVNLKWACINLGHMNVGVSYILYSDGYDVSGDHRLLSTTIPFSNDTLSGPRNFLLGVRMRRSTIFSMGAFSMVLTS
ncbi:hypothetical protein HanHA300_Chr04g0141321 [Helianthus annuus]|nr:hypothetical protein HanHA300_Chr04g0141321 [Helianthus annuus]KAJ0597410.1 hypothetical protein HanHA89_Chr04g0154291 [Helianthus annuus]KAJ0761738.1 hypothetical protein HanOQP8_Chr04g0153391 [Helianthus annuus]